jgi:hypothetical protein
LCLQLVYLITSFFSDGLRIELNVEMFTRMRHLMLTTFSNQGLFVIFPINKIDGDRDRRGRVTLHSVCVMQCLSAVCIILY